jgi:hypothetical protein
MRGLKVLLAAALALLLLAGSADAAGRRLLQPGRYRGPSPSQQDAAQRAATSMTQNSIRYAADNPGAAFGATTVGSVSSGYAACTLPYGVAGCVDYYAGQFNNFWGRRRRSA